MDIYMYVRKYDIGGLPYNDYTIIDLETTGLNPKKDEIIEISCIKYKNNEKYSSFNTLVKPQNRISKRIVTLTGITNEMVSDAPSFDEISDKLWDFLDGEHIVGYNTSFDISFLSIYFAKCNYPIFDNDYSDILKFCKSTLPKLSNYKLATVAEFLKIDFIPHRAENDCEAVYQIITTLTNLLVNRRLPSLSPNADIESCFYDTTTKDHKVKDLKVRSIKMKPEDIKKINQLSSEMAPFIKRFKPNDIDAIKNTLIKLSESDTHIAGISQGFYNKKSGIWVFTNLRLFFVASDNTLFNEWQYDKIQKLKTDMGIFFNTLYFYFDNETIPITIDDFKLIYPNLKKYINAEIEEDKKTKKLLLKLNKANS